MKIAITTLAIAASTAASAQTTDLGFDRFRVESGVSFELGNFGNASYLFSWNDSSGSFGTTDPTIEIAVGQTYTFQRVSGSHPFAICDDSLPVVGEDGAYERTTFSGAIISAATLQPIADFTADPAPTSDLITWTPTAEDVGTYYYTCTITVHPAMTGRIDVYDPNAEPVVHSFSGNVTSVASFGSADLSDDFFVGQPVTGFFAINETIADGSGATNTGDFTGALIDFEIDIDSGAYLLSDAGPSDVRTFDNVSLVPLPAGDYVSAGFNAVGAPVDGVALDGASYTLADFSNTAFDNQDPTSLAPTLDFNAFPEEGLRLSWIEFLRGGSANGGAIEIGNLTWTVGTDCPADTNNDGLVTPADFNAWIVAFNSQAPECDQNGNGLCEPGDFNAWIINFNNGC